MEVSDAFATATKRAIATAAAFAEAAHAVTSAIEAATAAIAAVRSGDYVDAKRADTVATEAAFAASQALADALTSASTMNAAMASANLVQTFSALSMPRVDGTMAGRLSNEVDLMGNRHAHCTLTNYSQSYEHEFEVR
jgi:hypothetical protein